MSATPASPKQAAAAPSAVVGQSFDESLLKLDKSRALLRALPEPKAVFGYLLLCLETPRPSGKLDAIRAKLLAIAQQHGLDAAVDQTGNVRIRKPATKGYEQAVRVALQSHLDVVCTKRETHESHNFETDPVDAFIDAGYLKANGTTLGADDGAGVAASLAVLTDNTLVHGPIEAVFTVDEETSMAGAEFLAASPFLQASVLINVDSEEEHSVCVGCAGGFEKTIDLPVQRDAAWAQQGAASAVPVTMIVSNLLGGHSGLHIGQGRANALQLVGRILADVTVPFRIVSLKGGNASNAIPRHAITELFVDSKDEQTFTSQVNAYYAQLREEFRITEQKKDEGHGEEKKADGAAAPVAKQDTPITMKLDVKPNGKHALAAPLTAASTQRVVDFINVVPHGVLRMSPEVAGDIDTSICFSMATLLAAPSKDGEPDVLSIYVMGRSASQALMLETDRRLDALARLAGAKPNKWFNCFPGWSPDTRSVALKQLLAAHNTLFQKAPRVYSVHAGLECGLIQGRYPGIDCVSIGPHIEGAHTPDEQLKINSVEPFWKWLSLSLANLATIPAAAATPSSPIHAAQ